MLVLQLNNELWTVLTAEQEAIFRSLGSQVIQKSGSSIVWMVK